jgi:osmotically-inducible protein OsmY
MMKKRVWAVLAVLACGCGEDVDRLERLCGQAAGKAEAAAGGTHGRLSAGVLAVRGTFSDASPECRVGVRLRWDKALAGADVQVKTEKPGVVRLEGTVADAAQQQRAIELAESTQGVEQVVNALTVGKQ